MKRESSPARTVTSGGGKHSFTARGQGEAESWEKRGLPSPAPGGAPGGAVPREKRRLRVGDQLTLQLPVWGSQGHWCSHLQGLWQPGPYQPNGHSAGRSQDSGGGLGGQASLHCQDVPGCGQSQADTEAAPGGAPSRLTQGTFLLTLHTGVSSEARGTGAGPLHRVTGGSIMTLTLLGTVFPEEATGTSWGGGRGCLCQTWPCPPLPGWGPGDCKCIFSTPSGPVGSRVLPKGSSGEPATWQA